MVNFIKYSIQFIALILLQVLILNNIQVSAFVNPIILIYFLIALPFDTPATLSLLLAFLLGITVDIFMNTPGILSFSLVFIAFIRPSVLRLMQNRDAYLPGSAPTIRTQGWKWYIYYSAILTVGFHWLYFSILDFSHLNFILIIWKTLLSSLITLLVIYLIQLFSISR